ncbi:type II toxin-antitoxin system VapC family toxin [Neisseria sp. ZJ106]|uniref:Ribonuclease VapC n=1 Tax=Neisseria lisongii TaxID=2912188 RepID=A0ABY7RIG3_9NEIS|nr:type II toxin-antitoxin system VapC family toxin [Neisseria lisongii]MCF7521493.1 type II toxin-antitoxin system VapC family toxin [Neisseria lisongii]WCL71077.1 type II toxin-antitoxin system VapC family toxin [Neisseria lisongii]
MYLLDTNIISEMRKAKKGRANPNLTAWLAQTDSGYFYTSAIVAMELERGVLGMERKDPVQGIELRRWLDEVKSKLFTNRILPIDETTARICAAMHIPDKAPENDAWIAATARQHGLTLVTRNTADFERTGARLFNPFAAEI